MPLEFEAFWNSVVRAAGKGAGDDSRGPWSVGGTMEGQGLQVSGGLSKRASGAQGKE